MANLGTNSVKGTKCISNLYLKPIGGYHLDDLEWEVLVFTSTGAKNYIVQKKDCKRVDEDNYLIPVDSGILGSGIYWGTVTLSIPDATFSDGIRIERLTGKMDIIIDAQ